MNCTDAVAYLIEPIPMPTDVRDHLEQCPHCRSELEQARRVAGLLTELPATTNTDVAGRVMASIGYGNGRPARDKIVDQLGYIRAELEALLDQVKPGDWDWRPSADEPSIADIVASIPAAETAALAFVQSGSRVAGAIVPSGDGRAGSAGSAIGFDAQTSIHDAKAVLRGVRERTLRSISGLDDYPVDAERLRDLYRQEADSAARIADTLWRSRRREQVEGLL